ncbi:MAG: galactokinase, partial [Parasporobacterium sp.]|nr:galactokinase [Parasporobacterium sp.]
FIHFFEENKRVLKQAEALKSGDFATFLTLVRQSGRSSWMYLQNVIPFGRKDHQDMALALALCDRLIGEDGAFRVHGGGFAGTVQAFVPDDKVDTFRHEMDNVFGEGSCQKVNIRQTGSVKLTR